MKKYIAQILSLILLASCQTNKDDDKVIEPRSAYKNGLELFKKGSYKEASDEFGRVYFQHPGNAITPFAELMEAYSLYNAGLYEDSIDVLDNFLLIHPAHPDVSYAMYLKGMNYYMQINDVHHDQNITKKAKESFEELINRFPGTKYALDAKLKLDLVNDHLAGKEIYIGRYYQKKKTPIGAVNRFQYLIKDYQTTSYTPEALYRLVESFAILGLYDDANKYAAVLGYNYPDSKWYQYAKNILKQNREKNGI